MVDVVAAPMQMDMTKFYGIFEAMNKTMTFQSSMLESLVLNADNSIRMERERLADEARRQRIEDLETAFDESERETAEHAAARTEQLDIGSPSDFAKSTGIGAFLGSIFERLSSGGLLLGAGLLTLRGLIIGAIAKPLAAFVGGIFETIASAAGASAEFAKAFGDAIEGGSLWYLIGRIFGKKFALILGVGKLVGSIFEDTIGRLFDHDKNGNIDAFQDGFLKNFASVDLWSGIGGVVATLLGWKIIGPAIKSLFMPGGAALVGLNAGVSGGFLGALKSMKFGTRLGISGLAWMLSGYIGDAIGDAFGSDEAGDALTKAIKIGAAVALVNPIAGLAAAALTLGVAGIAAITEAVALRRNKYVSELANDMQSALDKLEETGSAEAALAAVDAARRVKQQVDESGLMILPKDEREALAKLGATSTQVLETFDDVLTPEVMGKIFKLMDEKLDSGDTEAAEQILKDHLLAMAAEMRASNPNNPMLLEENGTLDTLVRTMRNMLLESDNLKFTLKELTDLTDKLSPMELAAMESARENKLRSVEGEAVKDKTRSNAPVVIAPSTSAPSTVDSSTHNMTTINQMIMPDRVLDYIY